MIGREWLLFTTAQAAMVVLLAQFFPLLRGKRWASSFQSNAALMVCGFIPHLALQSVLWLARRLRLLRILASTHGRVCMPSIAVIRTTALNDPIFLIWRHIVVVLTSFGALCFEYVWFRAALTTV